MTTGHLTLVPDPDPMREVIERTSSRNANMLLTRAALYGLDLMCKCGDCGACWAKTYAKLIDTQTSTWFDSKVPNREVDIYDLDGTLYDIGDRDPYKAELCAADTLNMHVANALLRSHAAGKTIALLTGRGYHSSHITPTIDKLAEDEIPYHWLKMRSVKDGRPDHVIKSEMADQLIADGYRIGVIHDDRQSVVDMWRSRELTCFQVAARIK